MSNDVIFLITFLYNNELIKVVLKIDRNLLDGDIYEYPLEPENREKLKNLLPRHVQSLGDIVDIRTDELFDSIYIVSK